MRRLCLFLILFFACFINHDLRAQCPIVPDYITGADSVCLNSFDTLRNHAATPGGTWRSRAQRVQFLTDSVGIDTIRFKAVVAGNDTIVYTITNICGSDSAIFVVRINALPVPGAVVGPVTMCVGTQISLSDPTGTPGGFWSSADASIATIDANTGVVTGTGAGHVILQYSGSNACGSIPDLHAIDVNADPLAVIAPSVSSVCHHALALLDHSGSYGSGVWSSADPSIATVDAVTGVIGGVTVGAATITYITNTVSCGSDTATLLVTVDPLPVAGVIAPLDSFCLGSLITANATVPNGTWSFHYGFATVISSTPTSATLYATYHGNDTLYYTVSNVCGAAMASTPLRIATLPAVGFILADADSICEGNNTTLSNPTADPGGIWGHTGSNVSVSLSGIVTALSPGTNDVYYTLTNSCGSIASSRPITVNPLPHGGIITGPTHVCVTSSIRLYDTTGTPGGAWSCSAWGTIDTLGIFSATASGVTTINYTASTQCGSEQAHFSVTIDPLPDVIGITGPGTLCTGSSATFANAVPGGSWSVNYPAIATISSVGVVTALTSGVVTLTYSVSNSCGTTAVILPVTVLSVPVPGSISGTAGLCPGDTATWLCSPTGGTWSASNARATIGVSGLLTGVSAGADTITYSLTNACGTSAATRIATIYPVPGTDTISGPPIACVGLPVTLTPAVPGGIWSATSGHVSVAGGVVTGISSGVDTIHYIESNACGTATLSRVMTVNIPVSVAVTASITPNDTICGAAPATLTATPVNGGTSPYITWYNGAATLGTGLSYSYTPAAGDVVHCTMVSSAACPLVDTLGSNSITIAVYPNVIPVVAVTASPSDTIAYIGQPIMFTTTLANCGSSPVYQWYQNGSPVIGATSATYSTTAAGADAYYCIAACDTPCAIAVMNHSNVVTLNTSRLGVSAVSASQAQYSIAPNPNTGSFLLDGYGITGNADIRFDVLDMAGRSVIQGAVQPINGHVHQQVDLGNIASGQYMLRLSDGQGVYIFRLQVAK